jgi:hypothetical protein
VSAPQRIACRIAAVQPPPGHAFDRAALTAAIETELARLLADQPIAAASGPVVVSGGEVPTALPAGSAAAGRAIARHIHRQLRTPRGLA